MRFTREGQVSRELGKEEAIAEVYAGLEDLISGKNDVTGFYVGREKLPDSLFTHVGGGS
jgi:hypothetical protein